MKKLEGQEAELMQGIIKENHSIFEINGRRYHITLIEDPETTVKEDVESDPELKQKLLQAKKDILDGKTYTTEEVIEMIDQGKL